MSLKSKPLLALSVPLSFALVLASWIGASTFLKVKNQNQIITVKGYAEKAVVSDLATWRGSFAVQSPNLINAYTTLEKNRETILDFLGTRGFTRDKVSIKPVNTTALYRKTEKGHLTNQIEAYRVTQTLEIESNNVSKVDTISKEIGELTKKGIAINSYEPSYYYSKMNDAKLDLLAEATKNARARAELLATNSKGTVGAVQSASQGVFQITPRFSTDVSDYGSYDTSTIEKSIKSVVTVRYRLQ